MTELLKIVLAKPNWQEKIDDPTIVATWLEEIDAQGISKQVFECMLDLLRSYRKVSGNEYDGESEFQWDVRLGISMDDIEFSCECPCACCADGYNSTDDRYDDEEEDDEDDDDSYKKRKTMKCLCTVEKRTANFRKFIEKFVSHCQFNDSTLKSSFLSEIAALEKSIASIDYHPGYLCTYQATVIDQKMCVVKLMVQLLKSSTRNTSFFSHAMKMTYFHFRFRQFGCRSCSSFSPLLCEGCYAGHTIRQRTYY